MKRRYLTLVLMAACSEQPSIDDPDGMQTIVTQSVDVDEPGSDSPDASQPVNLDGSIADVDATSLSSDADRPISGPWDAGIVPLGPEVWLLLGDSEMEGTGSLNELPSGYPPKDESLWMMRIPHLWERLEEPCAVGVIGKMGPAGLFGWYRSRQIGRPLAIINVAVGGLLSFQQRAGGHPSKVFEKGLERIQAAMQLSGADFKGFLQYDGANNAIAQTTSTWAQDWTAVEAAYRQGIGGAALTAPWFYTRLPPTPPMMGELGHPYVGFASVRTDQLAWQSATRVMFQKDDSGPWLDRGIHLNAAGTDALAQQYAEFVAEYFGDRVAQE